MYLHIVMGTFLFYCLTILVDLSHLHVSLVFINWNPIFQVQYTWK